GQRSERGARLLDQMELEFEELEAAASEDELAAERAAAAEELEAAASEDELAAERAAGPRTRPYAPSRARGPPASRSRSICRASLSHQVGGRAALPRPHYVWSRPHVRAAPRVHGDGAPLPLLGRGKSVPGRAWV